jgi:type I restriction enzyme, S subunit
VSTLAPRPAIAKRLKYVVSLRRSRVEGDADDRPYIGLENIESSTGRLIGEPAVIGESELSASGGSESLSNTFEPGDVLFGKLRPYLAKAWVAAFPGRCTTELLVMEPVETESRFLQYICLSRDFIDAVDASTFGSKMPRADWEFIGNMPIPVPPFPQQRSIADYLDRGTARLDALVAAKERVLGVLAEKRQALITRAVTRGLNPHAPLRDSGIPWLGEIPAHWVATRLKFVADVRGGLTIGQRYSSSDLVEMPYLRVANVQDGYLDLTEVATVFVPRDEAARLTLQAGDVLMNEGGDADKLGRGCVWRGEIKQCLHQNHVFAVRPRQVLSDWLSIWTSTDRAKGFFESRAKQSTNLASISASNINELPLPLPPPGEQSVICGLVSEANANLDGMHSIVQRTIALLKERRSALIAAAVNGQIDVESQA